MGLGAECGGVYAEFYSSGKVCFPGNGGGDVDGSAVWYGFGLEAGEVYSVSKREGYAGKSDCVWWLYVGGICGRTDLWR